VRVPTIPASAERAKGSVDTKKPNKTDHDAGHASYISRYKESAGARLFYRRGPTLRVSGSKARQYWMYRFDISEFTAGAVHHIQR